MQIYLITRAIECLKLSLGASEWALWIVTGAVLSKVCDAHDDLLAVSNFYIGIKSPYL